MGIKGLHKGLAFCTKKGNLRDYRGRSIAVDSSSWLHRSVYSVSEQYVESMERKFLDSNCVKVSSNYVITRCYEMLNKFHVAGIFLVMDGKRCPLKANESADREERRQQNLKEARAFKQGGLRYKAEEKYKMCIKIRDELTHAVMDAVAKRFRDDNRVTLLWSPYEADAQLARLCLDQKAHAVITEDSDVLVYSAAARAAFPVLFKLDRNSGSCDVISMDWLLSSPPNPSNGKPKTALEGLLLNFASRETSRPGFGVRLFVQGCVLAGCDYAPNNLPGVGLVNAFKMVRDNSFRNDQLRFQKILDSLPRKVKKTLDMKDYELTLAKSEAVFFYHVVLHLNGSSSPMVEPRVSKGEKGDAHHVTDHSPFLSRFGDNWTFLGESCPAVADPGHMEQQQRGKRQPLRIIARGTSESQGAQSLCAGNKLVASIKRAAKPREKLFGIVKDNPYTKKRSTQESINHSNVKNRNPFDKFARKNGGKQATNNILKYMQTQKDDVRAVKRQFPSAGANISTATAPSKIRNSNKMGAFASRRFGRIPTRNNPRIRDSPIAEFDYGAVEAEHDAAVTVGEVTTKDCEKLRDDDRAPTAKDHSQHPESTSPSKDSDFYDLTAENSNSSDASFHNDEHRDDMSDLGESDFSPPDSNVPITESSFESPSILEVEESEYLPPTASKYFRTSRARRITLDPSEIDESSVVILPPRTQESSTEIEPRRDPVGCAPSSRISTPDSYKDDDMVPSPTGCDQLIRKGRTIPRTHYSSQPGIPIFRPAGPLEAAFNRQKRMSSSQESCSQASKKPRVLGSSRKLNRGYMVSKQSFFNPRKKAAIPGFTQLETAEARRKRPLPGKDDLWSD